MQKFSMAKNQKGKRGPYRKQHEDLTQVGQGGIKLRQWRIFRGLTIEALAARADVSTGTITGIERAKVGWGPDTVEKLCTALKITTAQIFGINPLADREFWALWDVASESERRRIVDYSQGVIDPKRTSASK